MCSRRWYFCWPFLVPLVPYLWLLIFFFFDPDLSAFVLKPVQRLKWSYFKIYMRCMMSMVELEREGVQRNPLDRSNRSRETAIKRCFIEEVVWFSLQKKKKKSLSYFQHWQIIKKKELYHFRLKKNTEWLQTKGLIFRNENRARCQREPVLKTKKKNKIKYLYIVQGIELWACCRKKLIL